MGSTASRPYLRRLECLVTILQCQGKGGTFSSAIFRPLVLCKNT